MDIKAVIFDLDGVIVHTSHLHYVAWKRLAHTLGIEMDLAKNEEVKGIGRMKTLDKILSWGGLELDDEEKLVLADRKNLWYQEQLKSISKDDTLPGVLSFIVSLKNQGIRVGLGSASRNARLILSQMGITDLFEVIVDGNSTLHGKPDPEVFQRGAKALNVKPSNCLIFEDAKAGIDAALAGNFWSVGVGSIENLGHAHWVISGFEGIRLERFELQEMKATLS